ncbi:hypothetical protein [Pantoea piersonii]|jgi:hypothetical protein|uniref:hypothetical protein n=1 Tax=Pantoea piersonii TaxID=2364647 RepID=UPI000EA11279|nr:hypothetical protein [Pantoea piersonii]MBZ6385152.1 hypothetical protein [Pantoea piersonii]MBZ6385228.1 hypothetical protein [Pantoea piersonii]MBZ6398680.1 hypothetical protein [Pantoea piersonii]MBZ6398756.1 hypothetical protein [Pantoea piersonii]MBZ6406610.1 hypothetical protein [Pantoea piersonii]
MATVIDALVVTLGLDPSGFNKGQKDVKGGLDDTRKQAEQTAKDMEAAGKRAASFFGSIRTELLALVGVTLSVQGFKNFISGMTDNLQQLAVNSQSLDMSAKSLDGWQRAAEAAGSSAEKITGTLGGFQNMLTQIRTGGGQDNPLFAALSSFAGATGANFDYQNDNSEQVMRKIADNWSKLSKDAQRRFGGMFGFDNQTQQALTNGNLITDVNRFTQMSRATDDATKKAQEFNRRLAEMKQNFSAASQVLYTALIPYVERLIPLIERVGNWIATHGPEISKTLQDFGNQINGIADAVGGWENVLQALLIFVTGKWALGIVSSLGGVRNAMLAISRVSLIAGLIELQKYAAILEKKYSWLTDNPVANALNSGLGADKTAEWGLQLRTWMKDKLGINLLHGDEPGARDDAPRGIRNNNPGNLNYAGQDGATKESGENGRFAVFGSMQDGIAALYKQIQLYFGRGVNTIESIVRKYAPASDNNNVEAYVGQLVKATGKRADDKLSAEDNDTVFRLIRGIINHENGNGYVSDDQISLGTGITPPAVPEHAGKSLSPEVAVKAPAEKERASARLPTPVDTMKMINDLLKSNQPANLPQPGTAGVEVGASSAASRHAPVNSMNGSQNKTEIHIGEMKVQSNATSVNALSQDVQRNVSRNSLLSPSMSGQG